MSAGGDTLQVCDKLAQAEPGLILVSHLPAGAPPRYLTKRIRARLGDVPLVFGYWDANADASQVVERLRPATVNRTVLSLASARAAISHRTAPPVLAESTAD
jgi:hypothetical protein